MTVINIILVNGEVNISTQNYLKHKFGCKPLKNWKLMMHRNQILKNICISKDYQVDNEPIGKDLKPVFIRFRKTKVTNVDNHKKTITIEIDAISIWEDNRIKASFTQHINLITLPSITVKEPPIVWTPFTAMYIWDLIKRDYVLDPVMIKIIGVRSSESTNNYYSINIFSPNTSLVWSNINWRITLSCSFNFSFFPFDQNFCPFKMGLRNMKVVLHENLVPGLEQNNVQYNGEGFNITTRNLKITTKCDPILENDCWTSFGYKIELKRQPAKYLFQYYIPCITIVVASTLSFIVPPSAAPGRIALVVTQFLTLTNIFIYHVVSITRKGIIFILRFKCNWHQKTTKISFTCFIPMVSRATILQTEH